VILVYSSLLLKSGRFFFQKRPFVFGPCHFGASSSSFTFWSKGPGLLPLATVVCVVLPIAPGIPASSPHSATFCLRCSLALTLIPRWALAFVHLVRADF